jgi:oligoendopeptidase F
MQYYDEFFGDLSQAAVVEKLQDALYSLITGCMEDEFQQEVYEDPDITLREMNKLYGELAEEYGLADIYGTEGTEWVLIPHTFQTPFYYISYAVSMESALELWEISLHDRDRAVSLYDTLLSRDQNVGFADTLEGIGLSDPFGGELIRKLCGTVKEYAAEASPGGGA